MKYISQVELTEFGNDSLEEDVREIELKMTQIILSKATGRVEFPLTEGDIPGEPDLSRGSRGVQIMSLVLDMQNLR